MTCTITDIRDTSAMAYSQVLVNAICQEKESTNTGKSEIVIICTLQDIYLIKIREATGKISESTRF